MSERTIVNRYSRSSLLALLALVVSIGFLSAGCALSSRTALPELPPVPVLTITTVSVVTPGFTNTPYPPPNGGANGGQIIATAGGTPPLSSCSIVNDTAALFDQLPPGLSIMPTGTQSCIIVGTISNTAPLGTYTFVVRVADARGTSATRTFTIEVRVGFLLNAAMLGNAKEGTAFGPLNLPTNGGTTPGNLASCSLANGPAGLTVSVSGRDCVLGGSPNMGTAGMYPNFAITATDQGSAGSFSLVAPLIVNDDLLITTTTLPNGTVNTAYSQTLANTGGQTPFTWSVSAGPFTGGVGNAGTACEGLSMSAGGVVSGTPVNAGTCSFTAQVDDTATSSTTSNGTFVTTVSTSDTQALSIVVDKANSTTTITSDLPDPSVADEGYTVNVSVQGVPSGAQVPTGAVTVSDGTDSCVVAALTPGNPSTGSCVLTSTIAGAKMLTATYPGDANFNGSDNTGAPEPHQVNTRTTSTTVSLNPGSVAVNQPTQVTVTVTDTQANGTASSPGGTVVINSSDGTDTIGTCTLAAGAPGTSTCMANVTPTQLGTGTRSITANFTATDNKHANSDSTATPQTLIVSARTTSTVVGLAPGTVFVNQGTTVTVTVSDTDVNPPASAPGGTIAILSSDGTDTIGTCTLTQGVPSATQSQCTATLTPTVVGAGTRSITATYTATDGDHANSDSTGAPQILTVNARTTTSTVLLTPATVLVGENSTVTVTVVDTAGAGAAVTPSGTVTVISSVGTDTIAGTCTLAQTVVGTASCNTVMVTANMVAGGTHNIAANFAATNNVHANSSGTANLTVNARATSTVVSLLPNTVFVGETSTATVVVTDTGGTGTPSAPSGTVTIVSTVGTDVIGVCTLVASPPNVSSCSAGVTPQMVAGGTHNITATFTATDDIHSDSNSNASPQALTVNPRATTTALAITAPAGATVFVNQDATVMVTVSDNTIQGAPFVPGGTITLTSTVVTDVFSVCTLAPPPGPGVSASCNATATPQMVAGGLHALTASYTPTDDVHTGSNSNATPQTLTVLPRTTMTSVVLNPGSVGVNEPTSVMVTVVDTTALGGPVSPGGTIVINTSDVTDNITACALAAGAPGTSTCTAMLTPTQLGAGVRFVSASYTATDDVHLNSDSTATPQTLTVTARSTSTTVAFSVNPAFINQATNVTVTVADTSGGTPSQPGVGTVVAIMSSVGTDVITGTCTLAGATASTSTCTVQLTPDAPAGAHTVTATFAATGVHLGSSGNSNLTVNLRTTTTAVTFLKNPIIVNETTDVTVTVTDTAAGTQSQPGVGDTVTVMSSVGSDVFVGTCTLAGAGANSSDCTVQITPAVDGTVHVVTGTFAATTFHSGSSNTGNLTVNGRPTTTTVALGTATVAVNEPTSVTVTVTDTGTFGPTATPTGTITLGTSGTGAFDAACVLAETVPNTTAACTVNFTPATVSGGTHTITGTFVASTIHATSNDTDALTVNARTTSTAAALSVATVVVGESTTVTVTVTDTDGAGSPVTPSGTVTVSSDVGSDSITGTCTLAETVPGTSECNTVMVTPQMQAGTLHNITASYVATDDVHSNSDSTGTPQVLTVNARSTSTSVSVSPTTVVVNQATTVTVTVTDTEVAGTPITPTGTVSTTSDDGTDTIVLLCTLVETVPGTASCNTDTVMPTQVGTGTRNINASFAATDDVHTNSDSTASPAVLTVNARQTTTMLSFSQNPTAVGQMDTVTVTVTDTDPDGSPVTPAGTIAFTSVDSGMVATADVFGACALAGGGGVASCMATLTVGTPEDVHSITASFTDTADVHFASSDTQGLTVQNMILTSFTLSTATENRATTTVTVPIIGGTGPFTCMAAVVPSDPGFTVAANGSNCDIDLTAAEGSAGAYTITITATDSGTGSDMKMSAVTIVDDLIIDQDVAFDNAEALANGVSGRTYDTVFTSSGGQGATFPFSVVGFANPPAADADCAGLTFNATGALSGNTNGAGATTCAFTIRVSDTATTAMVGAATVAFSPAGNYDVALTIDINAELSITTTTLTNALRQSAYASNSIDATGGLVPADRTWSITAGDFTGGAGNGGSTCEGLSLTTTTGASTTIDGTPTTRGVCGTGGAGTFTVTVSEAASMSGIVSVGAGSDTQNLFILVIGNFMYVADPNTDSVKVIDWTTNAEVTSIALTAGDNPHSVAVTNDGTRAYVTLEGPDAVAVISTVTNAVATTIDLSDNPATSVNACSNPRGIAIGKAGAANNMAYVACTDGDVQVIDTTTDTEVTTVTDAVGGGNRAEQVAVTPNGDFVYVSSGDSDTVGKIDATNNTATQITLPTPGGGSAPVSNRGVIVSSDGARVYFADQTNDDIIILNTATDTANANSPISFAQGNPERFTMSEDGLRIFCTFSGATDQLVIIDDDATPTQATGSPVALTNNDDAVGLTIPPGTGRVYIALGGADAVARRNDTTPFASAGANIALSGATTPQGMAHVPIPQ